MNVTKLGISLLVLFLILTFFVGFASASPIITVDTQLNSYHIGDDVAFTGINTISDNVFLFLKGANTPMTYLLTVDVLADDTWTTTFDPTTAFGALDAGTYTIYAAASAGPAPGYFFDANSVYATTSVALMQPFLTATSASSIVARGDKMVITGTATASNDLTYYVFGQNKFESSIIPVDNDWSYSLQIDTDTYPAGQYFLVIQHPMYDAIYNIEAIDNVLYQNATGKPAPGRANTFVLFNTNDLQGANAAEALGQALDSQNIDDIYVKLTFIIAQPTLTMNPVSDVTQGSALKVSGTTNLNAGTIITVDVLSTAFTAIDKTRVSSSSFITQTTKVVKGADGVNTWELTFDTTGLNVDTYKISVNAEGVTSSTVFKVLSAGLPKVNLSSLSLNQGWNFISVPKTLNASHNTFGSLFGNVETSNKNILAYNPQTRTWAPILNQNEIIQPLNGYWIYSADKTTIPLIYPSDPALPSMKTLYPGWNAIGLSADEPASAKTALAGTSWRTLLPWNLAKGKYDSAIVNGGSDANSPDRLMTLGNGYWLYVDAQSTLVGLTA